MKTFKELLLERQLNTKEEIQKAISEWSSLPHGKQASEAKRILKASKEIGYIVKQKEILAYVEEIEIKDKAKWKRENVTIRGIKEFGKSNDVYGSFGKGLYTVPLSNKKMAKQYGNLYYVVNAVPKNPKKVSSLNDAELLRQKIINDFCKKNNKGYSPSFFESETSMEDEMLKLGYDGLIIKGREMVNYKPKDIKYFKTENELQEYINKLK